MAPLILLLMLAGRSAAQPGTAPDRRPIGEIEFFGDKGLGVARIRTALLAKRGPCVGRASRARPAGRPRLQDLVRRGRVDEIISAAWAH